MPAAILKPHLRSTGIPELFRGSLWWCSQNVADRLSQSDPGINHFQAAADYNSGLVLIRILKPVWVSASDDVDGVPMLILVLMLAPTETAAFQ